MNSSSLAAVIALSATLVTAQAGPVVVTIVGSPLSTQVTAQIGGATVMGLQTILNHVNVSAVLLKGMTATPTVRLGHQTRITIPDNKTLGYGGGTVVKLVGLPRPDTVYRSKSLIGMGNSSTLEGLALQAPNQWHLVDVHGVTGAVVQGCSISAPRSGIDLDQGSGSAFSTSCLIVDNTITITDPMGVLPPLGTTIPAGWGAGYGVRDNQGADNRIEGNVITAVPWFQFGIPPTDPTRQSCTTGADPFDGIACYATQDDVIVGNHVSSCNAAGILVSFVGSPANPVKGRRNLVIGNTVTDTVQYGIDIAAQTDFLVLENLVSRTQAAGIMVAGSDNGSVEWNAVSAADHASTGSCPELADFSAGILIREATTMCDIVSNTVSAAVAGNGSQAAWGISFAPVTGPDDAPTGNVVAANTITKGSLGWIRSLPGNTIQDNNVLQ